MDAHKLVTVLGGPAALSQRLQDIGSQNYSRAACAKWRERGLPDSYSLRIALCRILDAVPLDRASRVAAVALVREVPE